MVVDEIVAAVVDAISQSAQASIVASSIAFFDSQPVFPIIENSASHSVLEKRRYPFA